MVEIFIADGDRLDVALKAFRRKVQRAGVLRELKARKAYVKPSLARKLKAASAKRRKAKNRKTRRDEF